MLLGKFVEVLFYIHFWGIIWLIALDNKKLHFGEFFTLKGSVSLAFSLAGREVIPEVVSTMLGEEDASGKLPVGKDSTFLHGLQKQELDQVSFGLQFQDMKRNLVIPLIVSVLS